MEEDIKTEIASIGFITDLEKILNYLSENKIYVAKIGKTSISYVGELEDTVDGKRQVFEIERKVD